MVLWTRPTLFESAFTAPKASSIIGGSMLVASVLAGASWNLLVVRMTSKFLTTFTLYFSQLLLERGHVDCLDYDAFFLGLFCFLFFINQGPVSRKYPADLSLSTMMMFFGTTQAGIITLFLVTKSSWELKWEGGLVLTAILWGVGNQTND